MRRLKQWVVQWLSNLFNAVDRFQTPMTIDEDFPNLHDMSDADLVLLLRAYRQEPAFLERDKAFLKAIQTELKQRGSGPRRITPSD